MEFNNPAYDDGTDEEEYDDFSLDESEVSLFDKTIDYSTLNASKQTNKDIKSQYRTGPVPKIRGTDTDSDIIELRIGSIEKNIYLDVQELFPHVFEQSSVELSDTQVTFIQYVGNLGNSDDDGIFNYEFIDMCLRQGCINCTDVYGQTIMHEIARDWHTDIAMYLKSKGAPIDQADGFGRTPLFVSVASNHLYMIEWLLDNGADINARTMKGEEQYPIHYAAKYNNIEALELLIRKGANPHILDRKLRTPLHVAAEQGRDEVCRYLIKLELPTATYTHSGVNTIQCIIENGKNDIGKLALQQFRAGERSSGNRYFYLSSLGKKRGRSILKAKANNSSLLGSKAPTALQTIVEQNNLELILDPTILQLLEVKWQLFGSKYILINVIFYLLFTVVWTAAVTITPDFNKKDFSYYTVAVLNALGMALALLFIYKLFAEYRVEEKALCDYSAWKRKEIKSELLYCHPRWVNEKKFVETEIKGIWERKGFWSNRWNILEAFLLCLTTINFLLTVCIFILPNNSIIKNVRTGFALVFLLITWLRLNGAMMYFQSLGPFITMLGKAMDATIQFGFLFFEFFIPFVCAIWLAFGGVRKGSKGGEYETFNDALYQMFLLTIVGDYDYTTLKAIDKVVSQIMISAYFILVSCVCINLYVALLSKIFTSVYAEAQAIVYINKAKIMLLIEKLFPTANTKFENYLQKNCSPQILPHVKSKQSDEMSKTQLISVVRNQIQEASRVLVNVIQDQLYVKNVITDVHAQVNNFNERCGDIADDLPLKVDTLMSLHQSMVPVPVNRQLRATVDRIAQVADELPERFIVMKDNMKDIISGKR